MTRLERQELIGLASTLSAKKLTVQRINLAVQQINRTVAFGEGEKLE